MTLVDSMILDAHTPEGRTLKQFCSNSAVLEKTPATLVMNVRRRRHHGARIAQQVIWELERNLLVGCVGGCEGVVWCGAACWCV